MSEVKLKKIPPEVFSFIIHKQAEMKLQKNVAQYSLEKSIYTLLKEHPDFKEKK